MSLRIRIVAIVLAVAIPVLGVALWSGLSFSASSARYELERSHDLTLRILSQVARRALLTGEYGELQSQIDELRGHAHVISIRVLDGQGRVIAASDATEIGASGMTFEDDALATWFRRGIDDPAGNLGSVAIRFSDLAFQEAFGDAVLIGVAVAAAGVLAAALAGHFAGVALTRRLRRVIDAARNVQRGDFSARAGSAGSDEVADLGRAFDSMALRIEGQIEALRRGEERYRTLLDEMADLVQVTTAEGALTFVNRAWRETLGLAADEMSAELFGASFVRAEDRPGLARALARVAAGEGPVRERLVLRAATGVLVVVEASFTALDTPGAGAAVLAVMRDVTASARLLEELGRKDQMLQQSQRIEALGRLAGGIAHDFNNILTVISGEAEVLLATLPSGEPARASALEVARAAERASSLTRQLLAFGRRQKADPEVLDLNVIVRELEPMLRRLIGEDLTLELRLSDRAGGVRVDAVQLQQVVLNLVMNSRDAMPEGGLLVLETGSGMHVAEDHEGPPILHAWVEVRDTGFGMDEEARARIFEPFFTTKPRGEGTGLGLSIVHGIVSQAGGFVEVLSRPREGTTMTVFLPSVEQATKREDAASVAALPLGRGETILLVEDEDAVRAVVHAALAGAGYRVIQVQDGRRALAIVDRGAERIDLLLSDVVMPGLSGPELAQRLRERSPALRVLFVSGYAADEGERMQGYPLLGKPFSRRALLVRLREILDTPAQG